MQRFMLGTPQTPTSDEPAAITDTAPCVGCGLCCDGTLYERARAERYEEERLVQCGLKVSNDSGQGYFGLPCHFFESGRCGIYDDRFTKCRTFRCKLLRGYQSGTISRSEAMEKVRHAMALRSAVEAEEPSAVQVAERKSLRSELGKTRRRPALLLKLMALDYYLDRHFRNKNPQVVQDASAPSRD